MISCRLMGLTTFMSIFRVSRHPLPFRLFSILFLIVNPIVSVFAAPSILETRVGVSSDDAEENSAGYINLASSDLDLVIDANVSQVIGVRFSNLNIEPGATITGAYIQFTVDENSTEVTTLQFAAEASDSAPGFTKGHFSISLRPRTAAVANWSPPAWSGINQAGPDQRTPDLKALVQEVVNRPGWHAGNSMVFVISGSGRRVARSYDNSPAMAPLLHIEYDSAADSAPALTIANPADGTTVIAGTQLTFNGTATDIEDGNLNSGIAWSSSRDGSLGTGASVSPVLSAGTHTITASITDSAAHTVTKSITVSVTALGNAPPQLSIANPADGTTVASGTALAFSGSATDQEDGNLSASITWNSSRDGNLGTGASVTPILTVGTHTITATITDSAAQTVTKSITVTVTALANAPPQLSIISPADGTTITGGASLTFTASATDNEDGNLSANIAWSSSRDGSLGTGASVAPVLSVGTHNMTASITDSAAQTVTQSITVIVTAGGGATATFDRQVATGADDAEEDTSGKVNITSSDLELMTDATLQTVGLRFSNISIGPGSVVTNAWIQFTVDEANSEATNLVFQGQASANAAAFSSVGAYSISSRPRTAATVNWSPAPWTAIGAAGAEQRSPDLAPLINEIISTGGWQSGNSLAIIVTGNGKRVARAQNYAGAVAPLLHIEYSDSGSNVKPAVDAGTDASIILPVSTYNLNGTVTDDGRPNGQLTTLWTRQGGTGAGTVSFGNAAAIDTTFSVSQDPGTYILRLTANDGQLSAYDEITITVAPQSSGGQVASITQINYFDTGFANLSSPLAIPATDPAGVTFHKPSGHLIIADSEINEIPTAFSIVNANIFEVPLTGGTTFNQWNTTKKTGNEPAQNNEPTGIVYCENDGHFYVSNDDARRIYRYAYDGFTLTAVDSISVSGYANDAEDITCDPATGRLYIAGGTYKNILVLRYQGGFVLEANLDLTVTAGSAAGVPKDPEGIAFDPGSGHLFVISSPDKAIFEYTVQGVFIKKLSISGFSPATKAAQGIAIGPSSNNPQTTSFYIADGLIDNDPDPNERDGRIYEARINRGP